MPSTRVPSVSVAVVVLVDSQRVDEGLLPGNSVRLTADCDLCREGPGPAPVKSQLEGSREVAVEVHVVL